MPAFSAPARHLAESYAADGFVIVCNVFANDEINELAAEASCLYEFLDLMNSNNIRCRWQNHYQTGECRFDTFDPVLPEIFPVTDHKCDDPIFARIAFAPGDVQKLAGKAQTSAGPEGGVMAIDPGRTIYYKRARFTTRLPIDRLYSQSHYWLVEESPGQYRIGLTRFATRMLGDFVDLQIAVPAGGEVAVGQSIGTIEGFKAISEIYCVVAGHFVEANSKLDQEPALLDNDSYDSGWLYRVDKAKVEVPLDVHGYIGLLDATIDRMLLEQQQGKDKPC